MDIELKEFIKPFQRHPDDNGSPEVQIASSTFEIKKLQDHVKNNPHDVDPKRSLLKKVARRRRFTNFLKTTLFDRYKFIVKKLKLKG